MLNKDPTVFEVRPSGGQTVSQSDSNHAVRHPHAQQGSHGLRGVLLPPYLEEAYTNPDFQTMAAGPQALAAQRGVSPQPTCLTGQESGEDGSVAVGGSPATRRAAEEGVELRGRPPGVLRAPAVQRFDPTGGECSAGKVPDHGAGQVAVQMAASGAPEGVSCPPEPACGEQVA
eukprot:1185655-Prorocentrum_minimum.AAC.1